MAVVLNKHSYMRWYEPECVKMNNEVEKNPEKSWEQSRIKHTKERGFMLFLLFYCTDAGYKWIQLARSYQINKKCFGDLFLSNLRILNLVLQNY